MKVETALNKLLNSYSYMEIKKSNPKSNKLVQCMLLLIPKRPVTMLLARYITRMKIKMITASYTCMIEP